MTFRTVSSLGSTSLPIVLLTFLVGCGGSVDGFTGPRGTVAGTVTFDGNPVPPGSTVMFQSKEGNTYIASGTVKEGGKYELVYQGEKSLPAITYVVQISPPLPSTEPVVLDATAVKVITPADVKQKTEEAKNAKFPFPAKYHSINTSKLTFDVKGGSNTAADFKLEK